MMTRIGRLLALVAGMYLLLVPMSAGAQEIDYSDYEATMTEMIDMAEAASQFGSPPGGFFETFGDVGDPLYIAPLIDVAYFAFRSSAVTREINAALAELTGIEAEDGWVTYFQWAGRNDIALPPGYDAFKGELLSTFVDPEFRRFFDEVQSTANVNLVEVVWGGVRVDGIPSLVNATQITPAEALQEGEDNRRFCQGDDCTYPQDDELVFGVALDGDARAYPLRLLNWHEMFNDVIGHAPMLDAPDGEFVCHFRAPTVFQAIEKSGDWIHINGESAGCESEGWVNQTDVTWIDSDWQTVSEALPDASENAPLTADEGIEGHVTGRPVMLAYCTLCGAGILYDVTLDNLSYENSAGERVESGTTTLEFGSTGLLMRSNKLMYDRTTDTVWNAFTGRPAFGSLATEGIELPLLPVVVTNWASWLEQHPTTSVLSLNTDYSRDYTNGAAYSRYFNDPDFVMFPVWQQNEEPANNKDMIFGLLVERQPTAYPLDVLIEEGVTNDVIGNTSVVIVSQATPERDFFEPGGAEVRAYASNGIMFQPGGNATEIVDTEGNVWQVTEDALTGPDEQTLERIPGHLAFWFGWYGFYPETDVYSS